MSDLRKCPRRRGGSATDRTRSARAAVVAAPSAQFLRRMLSRPSVPRALLDNLRFARMVLPVGRHALARPRRKRSVGLAALIAPAAVFLAAGGSAYPTVVTEEPTPVAADVPVCCLEVVALAPAVGSGPSI